MACCGTRSKVDGPELCTVCLDPLPLPGPGADVVLKLNACGHCFHRSCAQEMLLSALRKYEKPRCPICRATLDTAPFGKILGQRRQPRKKRMANMRQLISVSEVGRRKPREGAGTPLRPVRLSPAPCCLPVPRPQPLGTEEVPIHRLYVAVYSVCEVCTHGFFFIFLRVK